MERFARGLLALLLIGGLLQLAPFLVRGADAGAPVCRMACANTPSCCCKPRMPAAGKLVVERHELRGEPCPEGCPQVPTGFTSADPALASRRPVDLAAPEARPRSTEPWLVAAENRPDSTRNRGPPSRAAA